MQGMMQGRGWRNCVADLQGTSPAGPREHALLLWALHASRQEGKQGLRRRFVRQLRQKELANGWLGDRLAAHLRSRSSDSWSKRHFLQRSWSDDDRKRNRGGAGHWWAWGLLHEASGPGDHSRPGVGPEDHRGDGGNRSPPRLYTNPISRWEQPSGRHHSAQDSILWTPRWVPEVQEVWAHGQSLHYTTISSVEWQHHQQQQQQQQADPYAIQKLSDSWTTEVFYSQGEGRRGSSNSKSKKGSSKGKKASRKKKDLNPEPKSPWDAANGGWVSKLKSSVPEKVPEVLPPAMQALMPAKRKRPLES